MKGKEGHLALGPQAVSSSGSCLSPEVLQVPQNNGHQDEECGRERTASRAA